MFYWRKRLLLIGFGKERREDVGPGRLGHCDNAGTGTFVAAASLGVGWA